MHCGATETGNHIMKRWNVAMQTSERGGKRRMGVQHGTRLWACAVDLSVDAPLGRRRAPIAVLCVGFPLKIQRQKNNVFRLQCRVGHTGGRNQKTVAWLSFCLHAAATTEVAGGAGCQSARGHLACCGNECAAEVSVLGGLREKHGQTPDKAGRCRQGRRARRRVRKSAQ